MARLRFYPFGLQETTIFWSQGLPDWQNLMTGSGPAASVERWGVSLFHSIDVCLIHLSSYTKQNNKEQTKRSESLIITCSNAIIDFGSHHFWARRIPIAPKSLEVWFTFSNQFFDGSSQYASLPSLLQMIVALDNHPRKEGSTNQRDHIMIAQHPALIAFNYRFISPCLVQKTIPTQLPPRQQRQLSNCTSTTGCSFRAMWSACCLGSLIFPQWPWHPCCKCLFSSMSILCSWVSGNIETSSIDPQAEEAQGIPAAARGAEPFWWKMDELKEIYDLSPKDWI